MNAARRLLPLLALAALTACPRLDPMQRAVVTFDAPDAPGGAARRGYLLRMTGYYDFLP